MTSTALTTLHSFPLLPTELQIMIWDLAIKATPARNILLRYYQDPFPIIDVSSSAPIPALLQACHLSRVLSQSRWKLSMGASKSTEKKVYVDAETDSLYFPDQTLLVQWHLMGDLRELDRFVCSENLYSARKRSNLGALNRSSLNWINAELEYEGALLTLIIPVDSFTILHYKRRPSWT